MKAAVLAAVFCAAVASAASPRAADNRVLHAGSPIAAGTWDAVSQEFIKANPQFAGFNNPGASNKVIVIEADGTYSYPDFPGQGGKIISYTCVDKVKSPGAYVAIVDWGKDGVMTSRTGEAGTFWQLKDGTYAWVWSDSDGSFGAHSAAKAAKSHCGFAKQSE